MSAGDRFAQWVIARSGISGVSVAEAVRIRDGLPLGVHEAVDAGNSVFGGGHVDEPNDDCTGCAEPRAARAAWLAVAS